MKKKSISVLSFIILLSVSQGFNAQDQQKGLPAKGTNFCGTTEAMQKYYKTNPDAKAEQEAREAFTAEFVKNIANFKTESNNGQQAVAKYRIPVVFHVYGNSFGANGTTKLTDAQIVAALAETNKDIQGLQADFATVNNNFSTVKGTIDMSFELAKKDPNGNPTTGIDRSVVGTGAGMGNQITGVGAWNNQKYVNIYIVRDLYNDQSYTNSGVCWYPNVTQTKNNQAGAVYNGAYVGTNTDAEFRSVLTHELGHFMNLIHTFGEGPDCNPGDNVADTPPHLERYNLGCPTSQTSNTPLATDCGASHVINSENFMDYNGCFCGYKNYTKGQVARMEAALNLNDVTRFPLWQTSNLIATGLLSGVDINENIIASDIDVYPNPSNGIFMLDISLKNAGSYKYEITDILGKVISSSKIENDKLHSEEINLINQSKGVYFLHLTGLNCDTTIKLINN